VAPGARPEACAGAGVPWRAVRALGNVLRQTYDLVDPSRIWEIATGDPTLMADAAEAALLRLDRARKF
jgi:uncharacterized protein with HEPN domain